VEDNAFIKKGEDALLLVAAGTDMLLLLRLIRVIKLKKEQVMTLDLHW
jgi:hypothetical protein